MNPDRIDFISTYCDRWCERCAFTSRCSTYATQMAIAMCGDAAEGIELALGTPAAEDPGDADGRRDWVAEFEAFEQSGEEMADYERESRARRARINETAVAQIAGAYSVLAYRWLQDHQALLAGADAVLEEAASVVMHDALFIGAKLHRALDGHDRRLHGAGPAGDHPVQNDANGSAKVALISIERSEAAWRVIGGSLGDAAPVMFADQLADLRREVEATFPDAWSFVRPGFDEPPGVSESR